MSRCRTCDAPIIWATTPMAARIPLDAEPTAEGKVAIVYEDDRGRRHATVDPDRGTARVLDRVALQRARKAGAPLFVSHFATCQQADEWRQDRLIDAGGSR